MIVFAAAGTWGDVQPHVALAQHFGGKLLCDAKWVESAKRFHVETFELCPPIDHKQSLNGFLSSIKHTDVFKSLYEASYGATAIVSSFFLWPAKIVAELRGSPWISTTGSPMYFDGLVGMQLSTLHAAFDALNQIREVVGLPNSDEVLEVDRVLSLSPAWLGGKMPPLGFLTPPPLDIEQPSLPDEYCYISLGSASDGISKELLLACRLLRIHCLCTGEGVSDDHVTYLPFDVGIDVSRIFASAKMAIIHGGTATACQALKAKTPIIVKPTGLDHFYNADGLAKHGATMWPSLQAKALNIEIEDRADILRKIESLGWL